MKVTIKQEIIQDETLTEIDHHLCPLSGIYPIFTLMHLLASQCQPFLAQTLPSWLFLDPDSFFYPSGLLIIDFSIWQISVEISTGSLILTQEVWFLSLIDSSL